MAGLTDTGLEIKTLTEILDSINTKAKTAFGVNFNTAEDSVFHQLAGIFADEVSDLWEGLQGVYDGYFPSTSTGLNLDNVADLVGVNRLAAARSKGYATFTGSVSTTVPQNTQIKNPVTEDIYYTTGSLTLSSSEFTEVNIVVNTINNSFPYTVTIDGVVFSYTSDGSASADEIVSGLASEINMGSVAVTASNPTPTVLKIVTDNPIIALPLAFVPELSIGNISNIITINSNEFGPIPGDAGSINSLVVPIFGITGVSNPFDVLLGRYEETDSELRARRYDSVQIAGAGTVDSIRARLRQISGVTNAIVIENKTLVTDVDGRPGKSFECVVDGGDDQTIGQTIWNTKPAGIEAYGDIPITVLDTEGQQHSVSFSRPTPVYIHFDVVYSLYNEEIFPSNGEQAIKDAMVRYGSTLDIGEDVILQRFLGPIYTNVQGISNITLTVATSVDGITPGSYTSNNVAISQTEVPLFATTRVSVSEAP